MSRLTESLCLALFEPAKSLQNLRSMTSATCTACQMNASKSRRAAELLQFHADRQVVERNGKPGNVFPLRVGKCVANEIDARPDARKRIGRGVDSSRSSPVSMPPQPCHRFSLSIVYSCEYGLPYIVISQRSSILGHSGAQSVRCENVHRICERWTELGWRPCACS